MYRKCTTCRGLGHVGRDDCESCCGNGYHFTPPREPLAWIDDRWHCQGKGIHAGNCLELQGTDGEWFCVRIESTDRGRKLIVFATVHGLAFTRAIDTEHDELRWLQR